MVKVQTSVRIEEEIREEAEKSFGNLPEFIRFYYKIHMEIKNKVQLIAKEKDECEN